MHDELALEGTEWVAPFNSAVPEGVDSTTLPGSFKVPFAALVLRLASWLEA